MDKIQKNKLIIDLKLYVDENYGNVRFYTGEIYGLEGHNIIREYASSLMLLPFILAVEMESGSIAEVSPKPKDKWYRVRGTLDINKYINWINAK